MTCKTDGNEKIGSNEFEVNLKVYGKKERTKQSTLKGRIVCT
jgi:poly-D-alanine transfer protein DltD